MAKIDNILLKSKFRGCMLGALLGDCLGAPFEGETMTAGGKLILQKYFDKLEGPYFRAPIKTYTDDTAMTKSVAKSLIDKPAMDFKFLAKLFVKEYFSEPKRGYGQNVIDVFAKLRRSKFEDVFKPAKEQFGGIGSYGNGGAMRVSPLALYFHNNNEGAIDAVTKATQITHTHKDAINGALLQTMAIQQCLKLDPVEKINLQEFTDSLIEKMKKIETNEEDFEDDEKPYQVKLIYLQQILKSNADCDVDDDVIRLLGNDISALGSVPTAIYCFLRAQKDIPGIRTDNKFRRCVQYAISLGGDTDTIASMTGSLAGAYLGEEYINEHIIKHCEYQKEMLEVADNLFAVL
ncbi:hypothetical protein RN001_005894 [Aquatica leii]|uniref:ADP-ribosylhydrolase ARH3 n=1 Tax=Aquatica leii TaxID=1421715 RepID=A0AAN7Q8E5_9COLE|nr:hypothetical protein RN001_005894 [Aquatica leii]